MKKKGVLSILMITRFLFLALALFSVVFMTKYFIVQNLESNLLEMEVFFNRLIYSPNTLSYVDNVTGRVYPGIIDLDKLNEHSLNQALNYTYEKTFAARISVIGEKTVYYNEKWYKRLAPVSGLRGLSGTMSTIKSLPIMYEVNGTFYPGTLKVEILKPKS